MKKITLFFTFLTFAFGFYGYAQNTCGTALVVTNGVTNTSTILDGSGGAEMGTPDADDSVWYTFTPASDGAITVSSCLGGSDTNLNIGTGTCGSLTIVASNDDVCDLGDGNAYAASVSNIPVLSGVTYYIEWDDKWEDGVSFDWILTFGALIPTPTNDECAGANTVTSLPYNFSQTDGVASTNNDGFILVCSDAMNDGLWYTFTPTTNGTIDIALTNVFQFFDPQMNLYSGSCDALVCVSVTDVGVDGEDENLTGQAVTAGTQYFVNIGFYGQSTDNPEGSFDITITGTVTLSQNEFENANAFTYFPNPVKNELRLKAQSSIQNVSVYNMLGQEVLRAAPNTLESDINMNELQTGAYFVKVTLNDATETIRVIKQ